jgi:hypothetical protein
MPYNLPKYSAQNFSIGPCVVYMGNFCTTGLATCEPQVDVGGVNSGATLTTTREKTEVFQGFPKTLVDQFATQETAVLKFESIEWNVSNLVKALSAGVITQGADVIDTTLTQQTANGDGVETDFSFTMTPTAGMAILPGSVVVTDSTETFTDNGDGTLTGDATGTGTVNYATGAISVTFNTAPVTGTDNVTCDANEGELLCTVSGTPDYNMLFLKWPYVSPSSLTIYTSGGLSCSDDGLGGLTGDVVAATPPNPDNAVEYETGRVDVTWNAPLTSGDIIVAAYDGTKTETLSFGGQISFIDVAIKLVHDTPKGSTITIKIWKAQGSGALDMTFGDDAHTFPMEFNAMVPFDACTKQVLDWSGDTLAEGKQLFEITIKKAAGACASDCAA